MSTGSGIGIKAGLTTGRDEPIWGRTVGNGVPWRAKHRNDEVGKCDCTCRRARATLGGRK